MSAESGGERRSEAMAGDGLVTLTATDAAAEIARGAVSAEDYARACLARIEALDGEIRAFVHLDREHVLAQARALDERRTLGHPLGPLHGIPVAIKDIIDTADYPTELGSPLAAGRRPRRDAAVVARLRAAGAVIIGKTVTTEFAYFHPGPTRNPHDHARTPGGSSSGSAAAVAANMVPLALGTQTNGSVIRPAAFCGVFAIKPSHGLVSRAGVLQLSRRLDHVGAFARSVPDLALILDVLAGRDPADPDSTPFASADFRAVQRESPPASPHFAFVRTPVWDKATQESQAAFEELAAALGPAMALVDLSAPFAEAWQAHRIVMATEMAHNLAPLVARGEPSEVMRSLLAEGKRTHAVEYLDALDKASRYAASLAEIFDQYDAVITPAAPGIAPKGLSATGDPAFCTLWTLTGLPALSLPLLAGEGGLPIGVQLVGGPGRDARLLRTATALIEMLAPPKKRVRRPRAGA
jgi:Asp-tRNA(Asn)/Glu-tRNA(Gln) amidotransferase A subunit family amidase